MNRFNDIREWAEARNLIEGATTHAQMVKLMEEAGELASGIARGNEELIKDSIGDCVVVLTILAKQCNMSIEECIEHSYNEIKDRRGVMKNGVFIKEEENV